MGLEGFLSHVLGQCAVVGARFQVADEFLPKLAAVFLVASDGTEYFEHLLGQTQLGVAALLGVMRISQSRVLPTETCWF